MKKKDLSLVASCVLLVTFIFIYWTWMLYTTQNATSLNTSKRYEIIEKVEVELAYHRGGDKLYVYTQNNVYMLDLRWQNEQMSNDLAKQLLVEKELEITVWEHIPRNLINAKNSKQIVDLRRGEKVYLNISDHNKHQQIEQIWGICMGVFISISVVVFNGLVFFVVKKPTTKGRHRRYR